MAKRILAGVIVVVLLSGAAGAQETGTGAEEAPAAEREELFEKNFDQGFYAELRVGSSQVVSAEVRYQGADGKAKFKRGPLVAGALGYAHKSGIRFEVEGTYRRNANKGLDLPSPFGGGNLTGETETVTTMFNVYKDFDMSPPEAGNTIGHRLKPFVGAGVGLTVIDFEGTAAGVGDLDGLDHVLAYQLMVGFNYWITPKVSASLRYAFLASEDPTFEDAAGDKLKAEYVTHGVMVGIRYRF